MRDVSFQVHDGERLGIAGLVGAGRTELLRLIFGADRAESGNVTAGSRAVRPRRFRHPHEAVDAGLAMVTEDRKSNGLLPPTFDSRATLRSPSLSPSILPPWIGPAHCGARKGLRDHRQDLEVRCPDIEQAIQTLSGGNQQKVAIAKWLLREADVFLFDEPTRGIDVAARRRIYRLIESLAAEGKAIVIVSSDLDELLETCDRIAVMSAGKLVATFHTWRLVGGSNHSGRLFGTHR